MILHKPEYLNLPLPDIVMYTAYKFGICPLCEEEKEKDEKFDNSKCIHCSKKTKMCTGQYVPNLLIETEK